ncbi:hypothetical protein ACOSP7_019677 [Xanthoceras sorbifolium]
MTVDVSDFFGKLDPDAFYDWITTLEDYFDWFSVSEERKVRFVKMKLKGPACAWWSSVEEQLRRTHQPSIIKWEEMKGSSVFNIEDLTAYRGDAIDNEPTEDLVIRTPTVPLTHDEVDKIIDHQFVSTRRGGYHKFLAQWKHKPMSESLWLHADEVLRLNPVVFQEYLQQTLPEASSFWGDEIDASSTPTPTPHMSSIMHT